MRKKYALLCYLLLLGNLFAYAQTKKDLAVSVYRAISHDALRSLYATSRQMLPAMDMRYSLVQVKLPGHSEVLGTGWLANYRGEFWAVMPYHIGGKVGAVRELSLFDSYGRTKTILGKISHSGNAGFHAPDMSLVKLPAPMLNGNKPLSVEKIDVTKPVYTFGYTSGDFKAGDYLVTQRRILGTEGMGIMGDRIIQGEAPGQVINLSGACGTPLIQRSGDDIYVVGMHEGSAIKSTDNLAENLTFAVDVPKAMETILGAVEKTPEQSARPLMFKGFYIDQLLYTERIQKVELVREGNVIFKQDLRNFPGLYSDFHSELAFGINPLVKGDVLRYYIQAGKNSVRTVEYLVP